MRKQCKRKVYKLMNPISLAIEGAAITTEDMLDGLRVRELSAIESFKQGGATLDDFQTILALLNICMHMAKAKIGPEALDACSRAEAAMIGVARRMEETGKLWITSTELPAVQDVFQYHDLQRQSIARSEYEKHIKKTFDAIKSRAPGVIEL